MKLTVCLLVVIGSLTAFAEKSECIKREVLIVNKTTGSVIYEEKDEGKVTGKVTILDCGAKAPVRSRSPQAPQAPRACQDCVKR